RDAAGQTASATVAVTVTPSKKDPQQLLEDAANTPNAAAVGGTIGGLCGNGAGSADFLRDCNALVGAASSSDPAVGPALDQITPGAAGTAPRISQTNVQTQMLNVRSRLSALRSGVSGVDLDRLKIDRGNIQRGGWSLSGQDLRHLLASVGGGGPSAEVKNDFGPFGIFASGTVNLGNSDGTVNQAGFDFKTFALTVGVDYRFTDQLALGSALSYVTNDNSIDGNGGYLDTHGYSLTLYGTYFHTDSFYIDGMIDYGWNDYDQQRNVVYQLPNSDVRQRFGSQYGGQQFFVDLGAGYQFSRGQWTFGPEVRLSYLDLQVDSYREHAGASGPGSAWAVAIDEQNLQSLVSRVGGRVNYLIEQPWGVLQPQAELSWLHEFKDNTPLVAGQFVEGATGPDNLFYLLTDPLDQNYFELGLGLSARFNKGPAFLIQYRTLLDYDVRQNAITAQLRWEF
ncbi:MAG: autotransporter outer membrane beta-barrel domain-containing protein, partial [Candidatus Competibacter sp.]|nr:autotransporter outer membrane beta-barrel domain-containing protein [Candidatus Competibacter sp.]